MPIPFAASGSDFRSTRRARHGIGALVFAAALLCAASGAHAGGGPENLFLVVNRNSPSSLTIANYYIDLRAISPLNVLSVDWDPAAEEAPVDVFREKLLRPVLKAIDERKLAIQIDYIVYSSDLPTRITLQSDFQKFEKERAAALQEARSKGNASAAATEKPEWPMYLTPVGSLNGLTFLWQPVLLKASGYLDLEVNSYFRRMNPSDGKVTSLGFRSVDGYTADGERAPPRLADGGASLAQGRHFFLSTVLGVTSGRGNELYEVVKCLQRSAAADGTYPRGTIYFGKDSGPRSTPRHDFFPPAVEQLKALGVKAEILDGLLPQGRDDVQGLCTGIADFYWPQTRSRILPGAICEHLTSYGGMLQKGAGQTPLTEFLRYGAAGASGAVTEPYNLPHKFPSPMIQVHYARGCTLAEAFYQSLWCPYQLLIVGDPLCRPWANIPRVEVSGLKPMDHVKGTIALRPSATLPRGGAIAQYELFVDGQRYQVAEPDKPLTFDTQTLADGYHELRVVAVEVSAIRSQGRAILPIVTENHGRTIKAELLGTPSAERPLAIKVNAPGCTSVVVLHNSRVVGTLAGDNGSIAVNAALLGRGPSRLRVVGLGKAPAEHVYAEPLEVNLL